jgi:hypothetical protein
VSQNHTLGIDRYRSHLQDREANDQENTFEKLSAIAKEAHSRGFEEGVEAHRASQAKLGRLEGQVMLHAMVHRLGQIKLSVAADKCWRCGVNPAEATLYRTCKKCED